MVEPKRLTLLRLAHVAHFGDNLKRLRERQGMTQEALAHKLKLKRPTPISLMEGPRKASVPKPSTIKRLAAALDVQPSELLHEVETDYDKLRSDPSRQTPGISFASNERTGTKGAVDGASEAHTRVLRKITGAYETLASEVQRIAADLNVITTRLALERDLLGLKTRPPAKRTADRRGHR